MAFFHILSTTRWSVHGGEFHMVLLQRLTPIIGTNPITYVLCLAVKLGFTTEKSAYGGMQSLKNLKEKCYREQP